MALSLKSDTSIRTETLGMGLVHYVVCKCMPKLLPVLTVPTHRWTARLSGPGWLVTQCAILPIYLRAITHPGTN